VTDAAFHFRPVRDGALFLPSVKRLIAIYLFVSVIGAIVFLMIVANQIALGTFWTADLPILIILTTLAFIYALPFDYLSVTCTRLVFESARPENGRFTAAGFLLMDIVLKFFLVIWCYFAYANTVPYWTRWLIRGWYFIFPQEQRTPWLLAATVEASQRYGAFYFLVVESVSIVLLLVWGGIFVLAVFALNGLSPKQLLFRLIIKYIDVQKRPLSVMAFFIILAVTPIYIVIYAAVRLFV
jgi:hypothetical protein